LESQQPPPPRVSLHSNLGELSRPAHSAEPFRLASSAALLALRGASDETTMRSGLQKPGTVPFLALVLFSLLSLMPTLAKEWDLSLDFYSVHLAYHYLGLGLGLGGLGLPRYEGRRM
jgi:hypothetical protein